MSKGVVNFFEFEFNEDDSQSQDAIGHDIEKWTKTHPH